MHSLLLHNGRLVSTADKTVSPGQVGFMNGWGVFSTLRVADGVLFAFERHWARMVKDAALLRVPMPPDAEAFRRDLLALVEGNQAYNATLRVAVVRNRGGNFEGTGIDREFDVIAFTAPLQTWGASVKLGVEENARHAANRFAGAKITSWVQNLNWLERAKSEGYDEVVLLNEYGQVSECTSANIFAITGDGVWTPPLTSGCLPGVSRAILLEEVHLPELTIGERPLTLEDLYAAQEVFVTSTTRDLLPVSSIAGKVLRREGATRERLLAAFTDYRASYVRKVTAQLAVAH
jgi:branched-chain amino acid aminotransferase